MSEATTETQTAPATTEAAAPDLMALAAQADAGTLPETTSATPPAQETKDGKPAEKGSAETTTTDDKSKTADKTKADATKDAKPESPYTKAQKEQARLSDSWKKLEAEKAEVRKLQQELQAERAKIAQPKPASTPKKSEPSAEDYEELAKQYEEEGNTKLAKAAREAASQAREAAKNEPKTATGTGAVDASNTPEFQQGWQKSVQELIAEDPELAKPDNPVVQVANNICNHPQYGRFIKSHPDGIKMAVEVAKLVREAGASTQLKTQVTDLTDKLAKANAEVERLTKATALSGSSPTGTKPGAKAITDMSTSDAEKTVAQLAAAADRGEI